MGSFIHNLGAVSPIAAMLGGGGMKDLGSLGLLGILNGNHPLMQKGGQETASSSQPPDMAGLPFDQSAFNRFLLQQIPAPNPGSGMPRPQTLGANGYGGMI